MPLCHALLMASRPIEVCGRAVVGGDGARPVRVDDRRSFAAISSIACSLLMGWNEPSGIRFREVAQPIRVVVLVGQLRPLLQV